MTLAAAGESRSVGFHLRRKIVQRLDALAAGDVAINDARLARQVFDDEFADQPRRQVGAAARRRTDIHVDLLAGEGNALRLRGMGKSKGRKTRQDGSLTA